MNKIQVKDKSFAISIPAAKIHEQVCRVAAEITRDFKDREPLFLPVLNGAFIFAADLLREVQIPCEVSFVKLASYQGTQTTGEIREVIGLAHDITGRDVIIVEDIIDSGLSMAHMIETLEKHNPASKCPSTIAASRFQMISLSVMDLTTMDSGATQRTSTPFAEKRNKTIKIKQE